MQRDRFIQAITSQHRLANEAERLRQQARTLPAGKKRDALLRKARQIDTASHINEWLSSPGLQTPQRDVPAPLCLRQASICARTLKPIQSDTTTEFIKLCYGG
jgi:hypothetical protein